MIKKNFDQGKEYRSFFPTITVQNFYAGFLKVIGMYLDFE